MKSRDDPSHLRQELLKAEEQRAQQVQRLVSERGPIIRGSYVLQSGPCGKPTCKCARGELHPRAMLYQSEEGAHRSAYVPLADRDRVEQLSGRYRHFRTARASLAKLGTRTLELADALAESLLELYPPEQRAKSRPRSRPRA